MSDDIDLRVIPIQASDENTKTSSIKKRKASDELQQSNRVKSLKGLSSRPSSVDNVCLPPVLKSKNIKGNLLLKDFLNDNKDIVKAPAISVSTTAVIAVETEKKSRPPENQQTLKIRADYLTWKEKILEKKLGQCDRLVI